ncbi:MAG: 50S ribosomal protein L6 [Patescibacteria group bacterium]
MSRIGRKPLEIPNGVDVTIADALVIVKGPKGTLSVPLHPHVHVEQTPERIVNVTVEDPEDVKDRALWGLFRKLIANAVDGVQKPFEKKLEFVGIGYRVAVAGNVVTMEVGFSHPVEYALPAGITATVEKNMLTISGIDRQLVGETAARIRRTRPPEPYKGKGIKYSDETIRRKAGKAAKSAA